MNGSGIRVLRTYNDNYYSNYLCFFLRSQTTRYMHYYNGGSQCEIVEILANNKSEY
jgi:hypothetical protein